MKGIKISLIAVNVATAYQIGLHGKSGGGDISRIYYNPGKK